MKINNNILDTIGNTPLVKINRLGIEYSAEFFVKLEMFNPGSSIKDRIALNMIETAEKEGILQKGMEIIEPTSGNTGIGLAIVCAVKRYPLTIVMPTSASIERRKILHALGANFVLVDKAGMQPSIEKAKEIASQKGAVFIPQQFKNRANPDTHRTTTALEIWEEMDHNVDVLVSAVGTGGTITGVGETLKKLNPNIHIIAVEPFLSQVLSGKEPHPHKIQGMGAGFIPDVLNLQIIDEIIAISDEDAFRNARLLARFEGIFAGISSGAAIAAAMQYASKSSSQKKERILIILPDTGERYLSTDLWDID